MNIEINRENLKTVFNYHERTKHHYHRSALSLGYMDWDNQPNPFRRYDGAPFVCLPRQNKDRTPLYEQLFRPETINPQPLNLQSVSDLLFYSLAISAWKQHHESRWALRVNPSSGNLHPTEGYLIAGAVEGLSEQPAVYHYAPREHGLEKRTEFSSALWGDLIGKFPNNSFFMGLSSIYWRESWKYGERAYRYCQHDAGHALAAIRMSAALLGWRLYFLNNISDDEIGSLLGLNQNKGAHPLEIESPDMLAIVLPDGAALSETTESRLSADSLRSIGRGEWHGKPNTLSLDHQDWEIIGQVSRACKKLKGAITPAFPLPSSKSNPPSLPTNSGFSAGKVIRQRRSALAFDGKTNMPRDQFYNMLSRLTPKTSFVPWDSISWNGFVHLGIFVHRVDGLEQGLYVLVRNEEKLKSLKEQMNPTFSWEKPPKVPETLHLYLLERKDSQMISAQVSCTQEIAADGVFSFGMIAEFEQTISRFGAHAYRNLFWETGMIGQVLYLESEAIGLRSTGIGCFFDDPVHETFGLKNKKFQSLYHFTVGKHVEDTRLTSLPAYSDLDKKPTTSE